MNRYDEIRATALDIADWVCADPADRSRMADDLVKLCGLMVQAVGKSVAVEGESALNDVHQYGPEDEADGPKAHNRYLIGERIQDAARELVPEVNGADLDRYVRSGLKPVWVPSTGSARRAREAAQAPAGVLLNLSQRAAAAASFFVSQDAAQDFPGAGMVKHPAQLCDAQDCPSHGDAGRVGPCVQDVTTGQPTAEGALLFGPYTGPRGAAGEAPMFHMTVPPADVVRRSVHGSASAADVAAGRCHCTTCRNHRGNSHTWVGALDGDNVPTGNVICGVCGADRCSCTTAPGMVEGPDVDCPSHGDHIARHCNPDRV